MADKPVMREEKYLAYLTGDYTGELPKSITRKEKYLYELCLKGMGGEVSPEEIKSAVNEYLEKNPVKPGATTEQAQQIEQNKTDIGSLKEDLASEISRATAAEETKADKISLAQTDRKLDALWKLNQGISYKFEEDNTNAYQKTVPSGAKAASIKSIGGKTIVWNQLNLNSEKSTTKNGISFINNKDGSWTITGTCSVSDNSNTNIAIYIFSKQFVSGHKYLVKADKYFGENYGFAINGVTFPLKKATIVNYAFNPIIFVKDKVTVDNVTMRMNIFDLTQMFGSGNEPSTPEEFEAMFPADYYPYNAGEPMSVPVNEVTYSDTKTQETSYPIPQAILNLPGYGWSAGDVRNEANWENKKYIQRVGKYTIDGSEIIFKEKTYWVMTVTDFEKPRPSTKNVICVNFKLADKYSEKWGGIIFRGEGNGFVFTDSESKFANANEVKDYFQQNNETIYYELNEEQIIDISDIIGNTFREPIEVEAGGTLTFKNSNGDNYRIPVPSSEEYLVSLAEVAK